MATMSFSFLSQSWDTAISEELCPGASSNPKQPSLQSKGVESTINHSCSSTFHDQGHTNEMTRSSKRRAALERSATSSRIVPASKPVLTRPAYPTFISSRSTRRTSWVQVEEGDAENGRVVGNGSTSRRAQAGSEVERHEVPRITRKGTYSSLPPSPTGAIRVDEAGLCDLSEQTPTEFTSLTLGIDPDSEDVLALAIQRIATQRGSIDEQEYKGSELRATSLPPDEFFGSHGPTISSLLSLPDLQRSLSRDQEDDAESIGGVDVGLGIPRTDHSSDDEDEHLDDDIFEDASGYHDGSPAVDSYFMRGDHELSQARPGDSATKILERLSWWDVLREAVVEDEEQALEIQGKWDRIANFLTVPAAIEKITLLGALLCLDSFLYYFTILPVRTLLAVLSFSWECLRSRQLKSPGVSHLQSILKMGLLVIPTVVLLKTTDASKMYHGVRGQDTIKLYVIFNALEIADKLCSAIGQDILDTLFAAETLGAKTRTASVRLSGQRESRQARAQRRRERARPFFFFVLALAYVHVHALVYFYQLVSLNVAVNSYDNALLTLLVSNQFVEIKGSVFKKFEKENLFQIMCADIVERFSLSLMLSLIAGRNLIEMMGSDVDFDPRSILKGKGILKTILSPVLAVILSEMVVDWLKHGFITKFNHVKTTIYGRYTDVLCKDILLAAPAMTNGSEWSTSKRRTLLTDRSTLVARRLGFAALPLACLVVRITAQAFGMVWSKATPAVIADAGRSTFGDTFEKWWRPISTVLVFIIAWFCLLALKSIMGLNLLAFAHSRRSGMDAREQEDQINNFGRNPIGDSAQEQKYNDQVKAHLSRKEDDMPKMHTHKQDDSGKGGGAKPKWRLEEVERWSMIKRIF